MELSDDELGAIAAYLHGAAGIRLDDTKRELVRSRLGSRIRALGLPSFGAYLAHVKANAGGQEHTRFVDSLTTNLTYFFREEQHFEFLARQVLAPLAGAPRTLRLWSAGCSSGEEPYTMGMVAREVLGDDGVRRTDARILATDLSTRVLAKAREGRYPADVVGKVPSEARHRFFRPAASGEFTVVPEVRSLVQFAKLNLMEDWPMKGPFDAIFCRNVMIYFDTPTKERLVTRFHRLVRPGGFFFTSLSESLNGLKQPFRYVAPGVYTP